MNTQSLNRSIGLAMSALQQARAYGYKSYAIALIKAALRSLNKARVLLKRGDVILARAYATSAHNDIICAIAAR